MPKRKQPRPTDAELGILRVLWKRGPSTVREVYEALERDKPVGYTTVLKFMQIMAEKGLVRRDEEQKAHLYTAMVPKESTQRQLVGDLLDRAFGGSALELVMQALSAKRATPADIDQIRRLLDKYEQKTQMNLTNALGWTLIHFLWQGVLIAVLLAASLAALRRAGSKLRYAASCAALLLMVICSATTFFELRFTARSSDELVRRFALPLPSGIAPATTGPAIDGAAPSGTFENKLPLLVWAWFGGVVALSIRSLGGWVLAARFGRRNTRPAEAIWQERFAILAKRLRISRPVKLAVSALAQVPAVVGWTRPIVLMPVTVFTGLTIEQIEALLAHELAHVRRHDYLINLLQTAAETLLFYHPAVWWVSRHIRNERENCCDDLAVEICGDPAVYVRALTALEQKRGAAPRLALAADGGSLLFRVQRLLHLNPTPNRAPSGLLVIIGIAVVGVSVAGIRAGGLARQLQAKASVTQETATSLPAAESSAAPISRQAPPSTARPLDLISAPQQAGEPQNGIGWLDEIEAAGLRNLAVDKLIEMKIHGVTGDYIRQIRAAGYEPAVDKLIELRIHGVDADYIQQFRGTGLQLTLDKLLEFRIHGITPDFVNQMGQAGLQDLTPDKLVELRIHGMTADWVREIQSLGYSNIPVDKLLEMRIHGVTADFVREAKSKFNDLTVDQLIQLKQFNILGSR